MANSLGTGAGPNVIQAPIINAREITVLNLALTPTSVAANSSAEQLFTAPGMLPGDVVLSVNKTLPLTAGLGIVGQRVVKADQIGITFSNNTGAAVVPAADTFLVSVFRPYQMEPETSFSG